MPETANADQWKTRAEAAASLECSEKTVDRYATQGRIQKLMRPNPGRRKTPVFNASDIERLRADSAQIDAFPVPAGRASLLPLEQPGNAPALAALIDFAAHMAAPPAVRVKDKIFLTLREAAAYTGLTRASLRRRIQDETLEAFKDGGWKIRRNHLDNL